jgi:hypothetical protein
MTTRHAGIATATAVALVAGCSAASRAPESTEEAAVAEAPVDPARAAVDELLETDRAFASASAATDLVSGLGAMFAPEVVMPLPDRRFARGREEAVAALEANPDNAGARAEWAPVRGGISSDGLHGFTFGYMTLHRADSTTVPLKYLAYWVKGPEGWRVAAYKRGLAAPGEHPLAMMDASLPAAMVVVTADSAQVAAHAESLRAAEQAFSDEAQVIGLGPAFAKHGRPDAINLGGPDRSAFVVGADSIAALVGGRRPQPTSPVIWSAEWVLVASSGDLGVTFGTIRLNQPPPGGDTGTPFFTIWRRDGPSGPWRYIAE